MENKTRLHDILVSDFLSLPYIGRSLRDSRQYKTREVKEEEKTICSSSPCPISMEAHTILQGDEGMYQRLEKASLAGDVDELHRLLQEDSLLLQQAPLRPANNPLHIAAALGHAEFVKEILVHKPKFATDFNIRGLTALHLACANGHLLVVKKFLQADIRSEVCTSRDKDGFLPIHTAALAGTVPLLEELLGACSENMVRELTCLGDNILHLAVKSNCFEAVRFLVERLESDHEFLNLKDAKGNTILHLTTARKQLQVDHSIFSLFLLDWSDVL